MIDHLLGFPPVLKILCIFVLIVLLIRKRVSLGSSLFVGTLGTGLWFGMTVPAILKSMVSSMLLEKTLVICAIVSLILLLSHSMKSFGFLERLLHSFRGWIGNTRLNLVILPSLIGLLPMPGGAIFSAPMVDELSKPLHLSPEEKTLINYWFRHVWEFCWPLFPGIILAASLASVSIWKFISMGFLLTLAALGSGYLCILRGVRRPAVQAAREGRGEAGQAVRFLRDLFPILIVILLSPLGNAGLARLKGFSSFLAVLPDELPLIVSLILSIGWVWWRSGVDRGSLKKVLINRDLLEMVYMVMSICVFKGILSDSRAVEELGRFFVEQRIPVEAVTVLLTFSTGLVVGITMGFVGTTFPIILSLFPARSSPAELLPFLVLGFCSGFCGVLLSPLHACLILTRQYFRASLGSVYRRLLPASLILLGSGIAYFAILKYVGSRR